MRWDDFNIQYAAAVKSKEKKKVNESMDGWIKIPDPSFERKKKGTSRV